jgi:uncharacterized protein
MAMEDTGVFGEQIFGTDRVSGIAGPDEFSDLVELANAKMPFGKYAGRYLVDLPETYVLWFKGKGFPSGKLGIQLRAIQEIQENGLEDILRPLIKHQTR